MYRVLKDTGSICLHCDPTASHWLKLILDVIFGQSGHFVNEIVWWYYNVPHNSRSSFGNKHDVILYYSKSKNHTFNDEQMREPYEEGSNWVRNPGSYGDDRYQPHPEGKRMHDVWRIPAINNMAKERLGYPTQKPLVLLKRLITGLSNKNDLILDPFCGCGTTVHAAEELGRNWIGIDISTFSVGLMKERILNNFPNLKPDDIQTHGTPFDVTTARKLARKDPFEFEKWVCGAIGAQGMFHNPGDRGGDGGVDGVISFALYRGLEEKTQKQHAIVQVKGGRVSPDSVRALTHTVEQFNAAAGIIVCFDDYMSTVENNRKKDTYSDLTGTYPVIQGFSIERLLNDEKPDLPPLVFRQDAKLQGDLFS